MNMTEELDLESQTKASDNPMECSVRVSMWERVKVHLTRFSTAQVLVGLAMLLLTTVSLTYGFIQPESQSHDHGARRLMNPSEWNEEIFTNLAEGKWGDRITKVLHYYERRPETRDTDEALLEGGSPGSGYNHELKYEDEYWWMDVNGGQKKGDDDWKNDLAKRVGVPWNTCNFQKDNMQWKHCREQAMVFSTVALCKYKHYQHIVCPKQGQEEH